MNATFRQGWPCLLLAAAAALVSPAQAQANECVIEIALGKGKDNYVFNTNAQAREVGYWDVDSGGAQGQGQDLGSHFINLSTLIGPMSSQECIEDIRLVAGEWNEQRNPPMGYTEAGWWDIDSGGSGDSNNRSTEHRMTLFVKKMPKTSEPAKGFKVIQDIGLSISNNKPTGGFGKDEGNGFTRVGWWDVDDDPGCGYLRGQKSCGSYGAILSVKKGNFVSGNEIQSITLTGRWEALNACRGSQCSETSYQITVGAEEGKEISKGSTTAQAVSTMVGAEAKSSFKVPGVGDTEITAKLEVTGTFSWEQQQAVVNSFTSSRQSTTAVSCSGANVMWQWKSNLRIQRVNRIEDVAADSLLTVCAPNGVKPPHPNDISWDPEVPQGIRPGVGYTLQSKATNKCYDAPDDRSHQWDCHGKAWQQWRFEDQGSDTWRIVNSHTGKCLEIEGGKTDNAGAVRVADCNGGNNQKVRLEARGDAHAIKFVHSNKCLDVPKASLANGDKWHQWDCHNGNNQLFKLGGQ